MKKMERIKDYLFLHLSVMIFSFTSIFSKSASIELSRGGIWWNPRLYLFLALMILDCMVYAFCWQKIIKKFDLHIGYANRSIYPLWSQLWAVTLFGETLTAKNVIGVLVVLAGVVIVSISDGKKKEKEEKPADPAGTGV